MPNPQELFRITHSSPELDTVGDFLADRKGAAHGYYSRPDDFLNIIGIDDLTNRQRIENSYHNPEEKVYIVPMQISYC